MFIYAYVYIFQISHSLRGINVYSKVCLGLNTEETIARKSMSDLRTALSQNTSLLSHMKFCRKKKGVGEGKPSSGFAAPAIQNK